MSQPLVVPVNSAPCLPVAGPPCRDYALFMSYVTVEVEIDRGRIVPREPDKLPEKGSGLLTILPSASGPANGGAVVRTRVQLPLIRGDGRRLINPTTEELDASLWGA